MKKFILKTIIFLLPFSILLIDGILPINTFTFRPWEALLFANKEGFPFPFYPNQHIFMISEGDLTYHTKNAKLKQENWITDELGYRNNTYIKKPQVLLIGDSFIAGSSIPQDSTLTNLLANKLNTSVYNMAPASFNEFIILLKNNVIEKPKLIVFSIVERNAPPSININSNEIFSKQKISFIKIFKDKIMRHYFFNYIKARILNEHGNGIPGKADSTMFFLKEGKVNHDIDNISKTIISYKKYCDSMSIDFIFLPLPNKETVYFEKVPLKNQPEYLIKLNSILEANGVLTINTLSLFNNAKRSSKSIFYHVDDTHWNSKGVNLVADELTKIAQTHNKGIMGKGGR